MKSSIPDNLKGKDLYQFLVQNKSLVIAEKKYNTKQSDAFRLSSVTVDRDGNISKSVQVNKDEAESIQRSCVINSCLVLDSHKDLHIPGLWKKSLQETKSFYLLQEHSMTFRGIITDNVKAFTKRVTWKELGIDASGDTEVLIFDSTISKSRNEFMFNEYKNNQVKNHSVGMRYVQIEMAINDEDYKEEFAVWNKYYDQIINKDQADDDGYFFAVKEAKIVEGSAVPLGSNHITPVLNTKSEQAQDTQKEPPTSTQDEPLTKSSDWVEAIKEYTFIKI